MACRVERFFGTPEGGQGPRAAGPYNQGPVNLRIALALALVLLTAGSARAQPAAPPPSGAFGDLARRADEARAAGRLDEAAALYRQALAARPRWAEGLWALGTIAYEQDRFAECRDVFSRLAAVQPKMAAAWALRGLCEFRLGAYARARTHLGKAVELGLPPREGLSQAVLFHQALLLTQEGAFDLAIAPLSQILQLQPSSPELDVACGLVLLRRPLLPASIPRADLDLVRQAGEAYCAHLARHPEQAVPRFDALVRQHPRERYLHYGRGLALAQQGSADAIAEFRKEIELFPDDVLARVELAFGLLTRGREAEAVAPAEEAARLAPGLFVTHLVLGRALAATGRLERGIRELETAAAMEPRIPEVQLALARAYAQAGRKQEAARANAAFQSLQEGRRGSSDASRPAPAAP
jgi:tetratricopeptide (TPR) repeat protein